LPIQAFLVILKIILKRITTIQSELRKIDIMKVGQNFPASDSCKIMFVYPDRKKVPTQLYSKTILAVADFNYP